MAPKLNNHSLFSILLLLLFTMLILASRPVVAQSPPSPNSNSQYGYFSPGNLTSSILVIVMLLITAFFLFGFFSIYLRQCTGGILTVNRQRRGLDPAIIENFPTMVYSEVKEHKVGKQALECVVCLSEFEDDEKLRLLPKCSHVFHPDCIDAWLAAHVTCPVCRCNLKDYKIGESPTTVEGEGGGILETATEFSQQEEERSVGPLALPIDAVVMQVKGETEEGQRNREEATELERIRNLRRAVKSKSSQRPSRFPRSNSTGHSLCSVAWTEEDLDRYTLRIPEHVLRQIIAEGKLKRTTSLLAFKETGEDSSRPGYGGIGTGEGSSRGGRSIRMFVRDLSERFSSWGIGRRGDGEGSGKGEGSTVRVQFDCMAGGAAEGDNEGPGEGSVGRRVDRANAD